MLTNVTLSAAIAILEARKRLFHDILSGGDMHSGFRGVPRTEIEARLGEVQNTLDMLYLVEPPEAVRQ